MADHIDDERDSKGRFIKKVLDPEEASAMGKKRWSKGREKAAEKLLEEAEHDDENPAPEHLRMLANMAAGGSVPALNAFMKLTAKSEIVGQTGKPAPGTVCSLCGELVMTDFRPDDKQRIVASEFIDRNRDNGDSPID